MSRSEAQAESPTPSRPALSAWTLRADGALDAGRVRVSGKGRRWLATGHPWGFRDDLTRVDAEPGALVRVEGPSDELLGWGVYSSASRIALRLLTRETAPPDRRFFAERVDRAWRYREQLGYAAVDGACRIIAGDADGLPGLVVDRYADVLVMQSGTQSSDRMRELVLELLLKSLPFAPACVVDRSDGAVRRLEDLARRVELVSGSLPVPLVVREDELAYEVDVLHGHKTGHYLDQRENRRAAARRARGTQVLDAFAYDGLFGIRAALAGASMVWCVDQSEAAGERVVANAARNGVAHLVHFARANCMSDLRARAREPQRFGLVVVDPPAFAKSRREVAGAARGYVGVNHRALELVEPGGCLVSASCSYNVSAQTFVDYLARAAHAARRTVFLEELAGAALDHPVLLTLPESHYLKCAFLRVS